VLILAALWFTASVEGCAQSTVRVLTVCDLVRNPAVWEDKHVRVKASFSLRANPNAEFATLSAIPPEDL